MTASNKDKWIERKLPDDTAFSLSCHPPSSRAPKRPCPLLNRHYSPPLRLPFCPIFCHLSCLALRITPPAPTLLPSTLPLQSHMNLILAHINAPKSCASKATTSLTFQLSPTPPAPPSYPASVHLRRPSIFGVSISMAPPISGIPPSSAASHLRWSFQLRWSFHRRRSFNLLSPSMFGVPPSMGPYISGIPPSPAPLHLGRPPTPTSLHLPRTSISGIPPSLTSLQGYS